MCDVNVCTHSQTCVPYLPVCVKVRSETEKREKLSFGHIYSSAHPIPHCISHTHTYTHTEQTHNLHADRPPTAKIL